MPKNMFCENLVSPRMCLRKSWISRTVVCERSGSDLSQKIFLPMFCEKPPCPKICFAKIWFPQGCVCENPGYPGPWFAKDQGQIFLKRFAIVKLFVATCAHILINEENNIFFLRNVGFEFHSLNSFFHEQFAKKTTCPGFFFAKILLPQECVCENLGESGPWYAKDLGQVFLKRCSMFACHIEIYT